MARDTESDDAGEISTDRETIRSWADEHGATPYRHREEGRYRIATDDAAEEAHEPAEWDDFFDHLNREEHVVVYRGEGAKEPFEVTHREDVFSRSDVSREELEERLIEGETVTSTVTETTVVEEVIVEEATIESELVDTAITDDRVIEVELLSRECTDCTLEDTGAVEARDWFDEDRYMATVAGVGMAADEDAMETTGTQREETESAMADVEEAYPFDAVLDVEESWSVTREFTEQYTVESRVADVDVAETDSVQERDIDVEGLQRSIVESDVLDIDRSADELMAQCEVESEFKEGDTIHTHFARSRVVEDEVVDRRRVGAEVTTAELLSLERMNTTEIATEMSGGETAAGASAEEETVEDEPGMTEDEMPSRLSDDEVGKDVVDASGKTVGMVSGVSEDGRAVFVDPHPSLTEKIKAALDWGSADDDDYAIKLQQIDRIEHDEIRLRGADELDEVTPSP